MPETLSKKRRSWLMSRIRGRGNEGTERLLARLMRAVGIGSWRRHIPISGRPDFSFRKQKVAVFGSLRPAPAHSDFPLHG